MHLPSLLFATAEQAEEGERMRAEVNRGAEYKLWEVRRELGYRNNGKECHIEVRFQFQRRLEKNYYVFKLQMK